MTEDSKKPRQTVKGQFIKRDLDKEKLEKALKRAEKVVKRNKRLGDLLANKGV